MIKKKNLSEVSPALPENTADLTIGLVTAQWNEAITGKLREGAIGFLTENGISEHKIVEKVVPGSYELPLAAKWLAERKGVDAVICLGCVIQGETRHFDFICDACANGIMEVSLITNKPVIFGVLTPENESQAQDRAGGKHGNKGVEAAASALAMLAIRD